MLLDRHRVAQLIELSALERTVKGPERQLRAGDVEVLVKAAYDDAVDSARAEFMARVQKMPSSAWPWSAVQVTAPRGGGGGGGGGGGLGSLVAVPKPGTVTTPALLVLLRGQADSADVDLGNSLPDRGTPEAVEWEPLYKALDTWDTTAIQKAIAPLGWVSIVGTTSGQVPKDTGDGATSGAPAPGGTGGTGGMSTGAPPPPPPADLPAPQTPPQLPATISITHPAVIAAGVVVVVATGVAIYRIGQAQTRRRLSEELSRQEEVP